MSNGRLKSNRGVALIMVLLVTALLIALVFEFAYGTRVSLRAAVNFRDSQRAYYLARSGVNFAGMFLSDNLKNNKPHDNLEQREWQAVPVTTGGDTELKVRWEDESGKIIISNLTQGSDGYNRVGTLFENKGMDRDIINRISTWMMDEKRRFYLLTELHQFLNEEDFGKVVGSLTVATIGTQINVNTASVDVLQSLGLTSGIAERIVERRNREPFNDTDKEKGKETVADIVGSTNPTAAGILSKYSSDVFKINSFATVGGYTKQVEAVITRSASGFVVNYWRAL